MTTIAGYDGSDAAAAAVRFARMLAAPGGEEVVVAIVAPAVPFVFAPGASARADAELEEALRQEAANVLESVGQEGVRHVVVSARSPAQGLHELAETEGATLICVGATHRSALGRLLVGGVGDRLLHGAPCPVAVVPEGWDASTCATIGVAFDPTKEPAAALRPAEELALRLDARLVVITAYDAAAWLWLTVPGATGVPVWDVKDLRRGFERELEQAVADLDPAVRAEVRTAEGVPGPALVKASHDVDLLVVGSRGYGPLGAVLAGSVSHYVADHAVTPVLIVPRSADSPASA